MNTNFGCSLVAYRESFYTVSKIQKFPKLSCRLCDWTMIQINAKNKNTWPSSVTFSDMKLHHGWGGRMGPQSYISWHGLYNFLLGYAWWQNTPAAGRWELGSGWRLLQANRVMCIYNWSVSICLILWWNLSFLKHSHACKLPWMRGKLRFSLNLAASSCL